jgi:hypothetical protein
MHFPACRSPPHSLKPPSPALFTCDGHLAWFLGTFEFVIPEPKSWGGFEKTKGHNLRGLGLFCGIHVPALLNEDQKCTQHNTMRPLPDLVKPDIHAVPCWCLGCWLLASIPRGTDASDAFLLEVCSVGGQWLGFTSWRGTV